MDHYWQYIIALLFGTTIGGSSAGYIRWLGGRSGSLSGLWHQVFNGHSLGDGASC
jgi:hypothetical protein